MVIKLSPDLEAAINEAAAKQGVTANDLANAVLRQRFLRNIPPFQPQDDWERRLLGIASAAGVSLSNEAVSSEGLYE